MNSNPEDWEQLSVPADTTCSRCGIQLRAGSKAFWSPSKEISSCLLHNQTVSDLTESPIGEAKSELFSLPQRIVVDNNFILSDLRNLFNPVDVSKLLNPLVMNTLSTQHNVVKLLSPINIQFSNLNKSLTASLARISSTLATTGAMAGLVAELNSSRAQILSGLNLDSFRALAVEFKKSQPENFQEMRLIDQLSLIRMSTDHGFGTVESLPPEVILKLLGSTDSPSQEVNFILMDSTNQIVEYCIKMAKEIIDLKEHPLIGYATLICEAGEALSAGHYSSSQTLSTAIWDSSLTETFGSKMISQVKKSHGNSTEIDIENRDQNVTFKEIYRKAAQFPAVSAYPAGKNHSDYSRNGTIHYARPEQFSKANALKALTIACGILAFASKFS